MRAAPSNGVLGGAGKWITWLLTTAAAVTALLVNARNLGLTAWLGAVDVSFADHAATRVLVTPRADSLIAIGDTTVLAATVLDRRGAILTGARLRWQSEDTTIADVDSTGAVIARGPGRTRINVHVRDLTSGASITVIQHPTRVVITSDGPARLRQGDSVRFSAYAEDARGHRIRGAPPRWRSADPAIVAIDSMGTALAGQPGITTISATAGGAGAELALQVDLTATEARVLSGDRQHALAGRKLLAPVVLQVLARGGAPVPGTTVTFIPEDGQGQVDPATAVTDQQGRVRSMWSLSSHAGLQRLVARVSSLDSALTFTAEADPVPGNVRTEVISAPPNGIAGTPLDDPVVIRVTDSAGAPLAMVPIAWSTPDGGSLESAGRTDSLGGATARWSLGRRMGKQRLLAQIGQTRAIPPLTIVAAAMAGSPSRATLVGGTAQRGTAGLPLATPVVVHLQDAAGNPVTGQAIFLRPGSGSVRDSVVLTDRKGDATTRWTLGRSAGSQILRVAVEGLDSTLIVSAHASAGPPAGLTLTPLPAALKPGEVVRVVARVTDAGGNPVGNALVQFGARGGTLTSTQVRSDDSGRAVVQWKPGRGTAERRISATLAGTRIAATQVSGGSMLAKKKD